MKTTESKDNDGKVTSTTKEMVNEKNQTVTTVNDDKGKLTSIKVETPKDGGSTVVEVNASGAKLNGNNASPDSIKIATKPTKTEYTVGDKKLDTKGIKVEATFKDGTVETVVDVTEFLNDTDFTGFNSAAAKTGQEITVTYIGKTATFKINIKAKAGEGEAAPQEKVLYEKAASGWTNCPNLGDLSVIDGQTKIVITFENTGSESRNDWGIGTIGFSTNQNDVYNTQHKTKVEAKFTGDEKTAEQEIVIEDYATIIATNKYLTANMWNNCVIIKVVLK